MDIEKKIKEQIEENDTIAKEFLDSINFYLKENNDLDQIFVKAIQLLIKK